MALLQLFLTFLMVGFVSFGGGYAMIPVIEREVVSHHAWLSASEYADALSIAGMAPGPYATNLAIFIGFHEHGFAGAVISAIALVLPAFLIVFVVAAFFMKFHHYPFVRSAFYVLRPIVVALIVYAAVMFAGRSGFMMIPDWHALLLMTIFVTAMIALIRFKTHPLWVLFGSGIAGIVLFT